VHEYINVGCFPFHVEVNMAENKNPVTNDKGEFVRNGKIFE